MCVSPIQSQSRGFLAGLLLPARKEIQSRRVHAITQVCGRRTIVKNVSQMGIAAAALNLIPLHPVRVVRLRLDVFLRDRLPEAGPAGSRFELGFRIEENRVAADAVIQAIGVIVSVFACPRDFSSRLARNLLLLRRQLLSPIGVRLFDFFHLDDARAHA